MTVTSTMRVSVPGDILVQDLGGESVFLNLNSGNYFGLDGVGTRMWNVLVNSPSIQAAQESLLAEYDVDAERLQKDLFELIGKLVEQQLVTVSDG